jgi:hypothetical protein
LAYSPPEQLRILIFNPATGRMNTTLNFSNTPLTIWLKT